MHRDSNLLFAVFAVQLRKVSPSALMEAAAAWASDRSRDLPDRLVDTGALSESDRRLIQELVNTAVSAHGGDSTEALNNFGGDEQVHRTFQGAFHRTDNGVEFDDDASREFDPDITIHEIPGRYRELSEYGRGGMGKVLLVHDEALGRDIVLKELLPLSNEPGKTTPMRESASMMARFLQEGKITGQLEHPAIAPVYELGYRFDGSLYYTMKLVRGRTLTRALAEAKTLRQRLELLPHFIDLCQALAYAHTRGVIHRDLKPANIMIGEFGETVILDWGLAKLKDKPDPHVSDIEKTIRHLRLGKLRDSEMTSPGQMLGTPLYMAPEQARGHFDLVDHRTDIYALGVMLYQLLTGQTPFPWTNVHEVLFRVANETPPPVRTIAPKVPPELAAICHKAMARFPGQRYQSAQELAADLGRFQSGNIVAAHTYSLTAHVWRTLRRNRGNTLVGAAVVMLVVLLVAGYSLYIQRGITESTRREGYAKAVQLANLYQKTHETIDARLILDSVRADLRGWEWGYLRRACDQSERTFESPGRPVLLPKYLELEIGQSLYRVLDGNYLQGVPLSAAFSFPRIIAADSEGDLLLAHTAQTTVSVLGPLQRLSLYSREPRLGTLSEKPLGDWRPYSRFETALVHSSSDSILAAQQQSVVVLSAVDGRERYRWKAHSDNVFDVGSDERGETILTTGRDGMARIWRLPEPGIDVPPGSPLTEIPVGSNRWDVRGAISRDGTFVVTNSDDGAAAKLYDTATGALRRSLHTFDEFTYALAISPDGSTVAAGVWRTLVLWDAKTGRELATLDGHLQDIKTIQFSADSQRIVTWDGASAKSWNLRTPQFDRFDGEDGEASARYASLSHDRGWLALTEKGQVLLWDLESEPPADANADAHHEPEPVRIEINAQWAVPSPNGEHLLMLVDDPSVVANYQLILYNVKAKRDKLLTVTDYFFYPNPSLGTFNEKGTVVAVPLGSRGSKIFDVDADTEEPLVAIVDVDVYSIGLNFEGTEFVISTARSVEIGEVESDDRYEIAAFGSDDAIYSWVRYAVDDQAIYGLASGRLSRWSAQDDWSLTQSITLPEAMGQNGGDISSDGTRGLLVSTDNELTVVDLESNMVLVKLTDTAGIASAQFGRNESEVLVATDAAVFWDGSIDGAMPNRP